MADSSIVRYGFRWLEKQQLHFSKDNLKGLLNRAGPLHFGKYSCKGTSVIMPWPHDEITADPNEFWRPWLEENVGRQAWRWNWRIAYDVDNAVEIKFRREKDASMFAMIFYFGFQDK